MNEFLKSGDAGIKEAAKRHDGTSKTFESRTDEERRANLEAAVGENPAVTVMLGFQFEDMAVEFAEQYPDQKFLLIDAPAKKDLDNLYSATFREHEPSYLLGVEAGSLTKSNDGLRHLPGHPAAAEVRRWLRRGRRIREQGSEGEHPAGHRWRQPLR